MRLLEIVSEPLRAELHFQLYSSLLVVHPFLSCFCELHPEVMSKVCHSAVSTKLLSCGDVAFSQAEIPNSPQILFVWEGALEYRKDGDSPVEVGKGQWVAEGTLWTNWMHRGTLQAKEECRLLCLDSKLFGEMVSQFWTQEVNPKAYARDFVNTLNEMDQSSLSDLMDFQEIMRTSQKVSFFSEDGQLIGWQRSSERKHSSTRQRLLSLFGAVPGGGSNIPPPSPTGSNFGNFGFRPSSRQELQEAAR